MTSTQGYIIDDYEVTVIINHFRKTYIMIKPDDPITEPGFIKAIQWAQSNIKYIEAVGNLDEYGDLYMCEDYDRADFSKDEDVLLTILAYENGIVPMDESLYELAIDLRDHKRPVRVKALPKAKKKRTGYVYLLQAESGLYKIGKALNPENRHKTFGVTLPFQVEFICTIKSDDYDALELELHEMFKDFRVKGEWFNLAADDVEYIKSLAMGEQHG